VGGGLALDAAWLFAACLVLLVMAAAGIATRRFLLERRGATVECGLRTGRGSWRLGVASYRLDEFCWFGVFGISMRPDMTFSRRDLAVVSRRPPTQDEVSILGPGRIVVECQLGEGGAARPAGASGPASTPGFAGAFGQGDLAVQGQPERAVELALAESALTGLLAWLEAAPPGSHLGVAL
jgi:hypothetical protein